MRTGNEARHRGRMGAHRRSLVLCLQAQKLILLIGALAFVSHYRTGNSSSGVLLRFCFRFQGSTVLRPGELPFQGGYQRLGNAQVYPAMIRGIKQDPGSGLEVGALQHLVVNTVRLAIVLELLKVTLRHTPLGGGIAVQANQTLALGLLGNVQEEFDYQVAIVAQLRFEVFDGGKHARRMSLNRSAFFLGKLPLLWEHIDHMLRCNRIPAAVVERHASALTERLPKLLHNREIARGAELFVQYVFGFFAFEIFRNVHGSVTRIQVIQQIGDSTALPGTFPSLEQHYHAKFLALRFLLKHNQLIDQFFEANFIFLFGNLLRTQTNRIKHRVTPLYSMPRQPPLRRCLPARHATPLANDRKMLNNTL